MAVFSPVRSCEVRCEMIMALLRFLQRGRSLLAMEEWNSLRWSRPSEIGISRQPTWHSVNSTWLVSVYGREKLRVTRSPLKYSPALTEQLPGKLWVFGTLAALTSLSCSHCGINLSQAVGTYAMTELRFAVSPDVVLKINPRLRICFYLLTI